MHAPTYSSRAADPDPTEGAIPEVQELRYTHPWSDGQPEARKGTEVLGYFVETPEGFRWWKADESYAERMFRPLKATRHEVAQELMPTGDFPNLCVRCGQAEPTHDASAFEQPGSHYPYDGELDDHCEDCLEAGQQDLNDRYDGEG